MLILGLSILTQYHVIVLHFDSQEYQILPEMKKEKKCLPLSTILFGSKQRNNFTEYN